MQIPLWFSDFISFGYISRNGVIGSYWFWYLYKWNCSCIFFCVLILCINLCCEQMPFIHSHRHLVFHWGNVPQCFHPFYCWWALGHGFQFGILAPLRTHRKTQEKRSLRTFHCWSWGQIFMKITSGLTTGDSQKYFEKKTTGKHKQSPGVLHVRGWL